MKEPSAVKKMRDLNITQVGNGFVVRVGTEGTDCGLMRGDYEVKVFINADSLAEFIKELYEPKAPVER